MDAAYLGLLLSFTHGFQTLEGGSVMLRRECLADVLDHCPEEEVLQLDQPFWQVVLISPLHTFSHPQEPAEWLYKHVHVSSMGMSLGMSTSLSMSIFINMSRSNSTHRGIPALLRSVTACWQPARTPMEGFVMPGVNVV